MKKIIYVLSLTVLALVIIFSCKKEEKSNTSLTIIVQDTIPGKFLSGVSVKLFSSLADWDSESNQVGATQISDASGKVVFDNLSNTIYYWLAQKDCENNRITNNSGGLLQTLTLGINNQYYTSITKVGVLQLINSSNNKYFVYLRLPGYTYYLLTPLESNTILNYSIYPGNCIIKTCQDAPIIPRSDQIADSTFVTVNCGLTSTLNIP